MLFAAWRESGRLASIGIKRAHDGPRNEPKHASKTLREDNALRSSPSRRGAAGWGEAAAFDVADRTALWHVVNDLCRPMQQAFSLPLPCLKVDMAGGFAVIRAPGEKTRILFVPTEKIEGIESPAVLGDQ